MPKKETADPSGPRFLLKIMLRQQCDRQRLLLGAEDRVLGGLGDAELHPRLGRNLDGLALLFAKLHDHFARLALG